MSDTDYRRYRIAILAPFPPIQGGMSTLAVEMANRLAEDGHKVIRFNLGTGKHGLILLPLLYVRMALLFLRVDIVQIVSASGKALWGKDLPALIFARILGKKTVLDFVGGAAVDIAISRKWWIQIPFRIAHAVVVPTNSFKDSLVHAGISAKFEVIPHTVNISPFLDITPQKRNPKLLLAAKGIVSYAGIDLLLDVFAQVKKHNADAEFWIAGDGPCRSDLESRIKKEEIEGVKFLGPISHHDIPLIMAQTSIFVHGTKYESFGIALVEAMAAGLPIVAFEVGGIPEVVSRHETGFLVPYGDTMSFAHHVIELLDNPRLLEEMRPRVQEHSKRFSWESIKSIWYKLYSTL